MTFTTGSFASGGLSLSLSGSADFQWTAVMDVAATCTLVAASTRVHMAVTLNVLGTLNLNSATILGGSTIYGTGTVTLGSTGVVVFGGSPPTSITATTFSTLSLFLAHSSGLAASLYFCL